VHSHEKPFQARARWLLAQIKQEIPTLGGIVSCNGDSWLVPVGYPDADDLVTCHAEGEDYQGRLRHVLDGEPVKVSQTCRRWIKELNDIAYMCNYSQNHTLTGGLKEKL
jgi:hypothetical protein